MYVQNRFQVAALTALAFAAPWHSLPFFRLWKSADTWFFLANGCVWKKGDTPFHQGEQQFHLDPLGSTWIIHWLSLWVSIETNGLIIILSTQKLIILVEDMMINPLTYPPWPAGQPQGRQFPSTRSLIEGCARGPRRYTRLVPWYLRLNLIISLPLFLNW